MSDYVVYINDENTFIGADTRECVTLENKNYWLNDNTKKLHIIGDKVVFGAGVTVILKEIINEFKSSNVYTIQNLEIISKRIGSKFEKEVPSITDDGLSGYADISVVSVVGGKNMFYNLNSQDNFKPYSYMATSKNYVPIAAGFNAKENITLAKSLQNKLPIIEIYKKIYAHNASEEVGGFLNLIGINRNTGIFLNETYTIPDNKPLLKMEDYPHLFSRYTLLGNSILGQRVVVGDKDGIWMMNGPKTTVTDRYGREAMLLGLMQENPDKFGMLVNRYKDDDPNSTPINKISVEEDGGFMIERNENGTFEKTFYTSADGDLYMKGNFQAGEGERIFKVTHDGFQLGGSNWDTAPLHADMYGNVWMNKLFADSAEIKNSLFKDGHVRGSDLMLEDGNGGIISMFPEYGLWFGTSDFASSPASISMDGIATFKKLIVTNGVGGLMIDSENSYIDMNLWDIKGAGAIDAKLISANIVSAEMGYISDIVAKSLSTMTRAAIAGWSNFIEIKDKTIQWITGKVNQGEHISINGKPMYWVESSETGLMTNEVTPWPVYKYNSDAASKKVKMEAGFDGEGDDANPYIDMGIGDGGTARSGKGRIAKQNGGMKIEYSGSNYGFERSIEFKDSGIVVTNEKAKFSATSKEFEFLANEGAYKIGLTNGTIFEVSPTGVNMDVQGDISIKATGTVTINGQTIKLN